jgi:hypothetical protein
MFQGSFHSLLHAKCSACYLQRRNKPTFSQNAIFHPLLPKIYCNFLYDGDISTFKRPFHSLLHAKCRARHLRRRNKPTFSHNAIFHPILTKIYCTFLYVGAISTSKGSFHSLLHAKCSARYFQRRNKPTFSHNAIFHPILTKIYCNFLYVRANSTFKRSFHSLLHAKCSARHVQRRNKPTFSHNAIFHPILTKIYCNLLYVEDISTCKRSFHSLLHAKCSACYFQRRNKPTFSQNAIFHPLLPKNANNFLPDRDISMPKRTNCCILRVERAACRNKRQEKPNKSQKTITRRY